MTEVNVRDKSGQVLRYYNVRGYHVPAFYLPADKIKEIVLNMPDFYCRNDDIMLCTYPKTGTNWVYEIIMMLLCGSSKRIEYNKVQTMLEMQPSEMIDDQPSPRVLNTHLSPRFFPTDLATKQIKTILVLRNPRDTAVSYYHHMTGLNQYNYQGKWEDWLPLYIHGKLEYGKYTTYLREWESLIEAGIKFPLHIIYYEDLHQDCVKEVQRLAEFLGVKLSNTLIQDIVDMCDFDKMAKDKFQSSVKKLLFQDHFQFFRKGKVGDWKNWFTPEQRREYDALWNKEMAGLTCFKFVYDHTELRSKL